MICWSWYTLYIPPHSLLRLADPRPLQHLAAQEQTCPVDANARKVPGQTGMISLQGWNADFPSGDMCFFNLRLVLQFLRSVPKKNPCCLVALAWKHCVCWRSLHFHDCWSADRREKMVALPFLAEILYTKMDYGLRGMPTSYPPWMSKTMSFPHYSTSNFSMLTLSSFRFTLHRLWVVTHGSMAHMARYPHAQRIDPRL